MLKKYKKKILLGLVAASMIFSVTTVVHAEPFAVTVTKLKDGESTEVKKLANHSKAQAVVSSMNVNGTYIMWVEKTSTGTNVTNSKEFSSPGTCTMTYNKPVYASDTYSARLNISTVITNFSTATIEGTWTPNH